MKVKYAIETPNVLCKVQAYFLNAGQPDECVILLLICPVTLLRGKVVVEEGAERPGSD